MGEKKGENGCLELRALRTAFDLVYPIQLYYVQFVGVVAYCRKAGVLEMNKQHSMETRFDTIQSLCSLHPPQGAPPQLWPYPYVRRLLLIGQFLIRPLGMVVRVELVHTSICSLSYN